MGRSSRQSVQKRQRERKKAEKAEMKREARAERKEGSGGGDRVATWEELEGYGLRSEDAETGEPAEKR